MDIPNETQISAEKTGQPHVVDVTHLRYRDIHGREFTQYIIVFSDDSYCWIRKPKDEEVLRDVQ